MRTPVHATAFSILLLASGCGDSPRSRVHGKVTFQGKPVAEAIVTFFAPDNSVHNAETNADGNYDVAGVPRASCRVSVQMLPSRSGAPALSPDRLKGKAAPRLPEAPPRVELPAKYGSPDSSGLTIELKDPDHEYDIPLN